MQIDNDINMLNLKKTLESCCRGDDNCETCAGKDCLVGFAKIVSDYANVKKALTIPNGLKMVPMQDFKVYETEQIARALAATNLECKNCMDSHDDNCVISVIRASLEIALLGKNIEFSGNPLAYVMDLSQVDAEIGQLVMQHYNDLKTHYHA